MQNLRECIKNAQDKKVAIGHFNISTLDNLWAIFRAAQKINVPVIIGLSEGERSFVGARQAVALVKSLREEFNFPIFINADHSYSFDKVKEAVDLGFDAAIFDGAKLSFEENVEITKQCVQYAKSSGGQTLIEGELGYIGSSSKILEEIPEGVATDSLKFTTKEEAMRFVQETGVDLFAPAVGNIHGMLRGGNPKLDIEKIKEIKEASSVPVVLHGGSGISDSDFSNAIESGISIVHINTEIRVAWKQALMISLQDQPDEIAPYKILKKSLNDVSSLVEKRLKLFSRL